MRAIRYPAQIRTQCINFICPNFRGNLVRLAHKTVKKEFRLPAQAGLIIFLAIIIIVLTAILLWPVKKVQSPLQKILGIQIISPKSGEIVSLPLKIVGVVSGDGWSGFEGQVGTVAFVLDKDQTIVCVVGDFGAEKHGYAARVLDAIKHIPVRMISYGGSAYNISMLINTDHKTEALRSLHNRIFE